MSGKLVEINPPYKPHIKQVMLHQAPVATDEVMMVLFGGERGGGKSAGILADAIMFATTYPGAKCCIVRENLDAVKQSFLDKLGRLFPQMIQGMKIFEYREKSSSMSAPLSRSIVFPNGSYITLQRVANLAEAEAKQGWEFNYLAIDELTKQTEDTFNYLLSTVRSAEMYNEHTGQTLMIPTKVVAGCNPGGIGHRWVKERFIVPTVIEYHPEKRTPLRTKDHVTWIEVPSRDNPDEMEKIKMTVRFIPASWRDNPYLNRAYVAMLMQQSETRRKMDMEGNWDVVAGKMFEYGEDSRIPHFEAMQMVNTLTPEIYISIDWGYKPSYHSAHWYAVFFDGSVLVFDELYGQELIFEDFVKAIMNKSTGRHIVGTCLPHDMYRHGDRHRDEQGRIIGEMKSDVFDYYGLNPMGIESGKGKVQMRYDKIHSASKIKGSNDKKKFRISDNCTHLLDELDEAVTDDKNPSVIAKACKEHAIDDYGLFLVMYSSDIAPLGVSDYDVPDTRSKWQKRMDEYEKNMENEDSDSYRQNDAYHSNIDYDGDLV